MSRSPTSTRTCTTRRRSSRSTSGARTTRSSPSSTWSTAMAIGARRDRAVDADASAARVPRHVPLHQPEQLLPVRHHARHDHGDLPAHGAVPRRLRQLPDPAHVRRARHGLPVPEHDQLLGLPARRAGARRELLRAGRADRCRLDALSAAGDPRRHAGRELGHHADAGVAGHLHHRLHDGRPELRRDRAAGPLPRA